MIYIIMFCTGYSCWSLFTDSVLDLISWLGEFQDLWLWHSPFPHKYHNRIAYLCPCKTAWDIWISNYNLVLKLLFLVESLCLLFFLRSSLPYKALAPPSPTHWLRSILLHLPSHESWHFCFNYKTLFPTMLKVGCSFSAMRTLSCLLPV